MNSTSEMSSLNTVKLNLSNQSAIAPQKSLCFKSLILVNLVANLTVSHSLSPQIVKLVRVSVANGNISSVSSFHVMFGFILFLIIHNLSLAFSHKGNY